MYPPLLQSLLPEVTPKRRVSKLLGQSQLALFLCV